MKEFLQGNIAASYGAIDGGIDFFAGYPITPSSEILEMFSKELPKFGKIFLQMEDELASICAVVGASLSGKKALTATSGPGFSLMQEGIGYATITEAPCVIINVMRGGPSTGLPTNVSQGDYMQSKWGTHGDHPMIVFSPKNPQEFYWLTRISFDVAFYYRNPVIILSDESVAHMRAEVERTLPPYNLKFKEKEKLDLPFNFEYDLTSNPFIGEGKKVRITGLFHDETGFPTNEKSNVEKVMNHLMNKIEHNKENLFLYESDGLENAEIAFVGFGIIGGLIKELKNIFDSKGFKTGFFRPITLNPLDDIKIINLFKNIEKVIVIELNKGQLFLDIKRILSCNKEINFIGFTRGDIPKIGEVYKKIEELL
ncbi:MAG: 2-oxoacid:acceptor oxidoreductase subunit alpha [Caldisericia bacterium]